MTKELNKDVDDFLAHYGVLGMKWGVRKDKNRAKKARTKSKSPKKPPKVKKSIKYLIAASITMGMGFVLPLLGNKLVDMELSRIKKFNVVRSVENVKNIQKIINNADKVRLASAFSGAAAMAVGAGLAGVSRINQLKEQNSKITTAQIVDKLLF